MAGKGWSHISLAMLDMHATRQFSEGVLGSQKDPNGILLDYSYLTRDFDEDDGVMQPRFTMSLIEDSPITDFRDH